ncbi:MAG: hypothetical protein ACH34U_01890, partial [Cyanobium sp.]
MSASPSRSPALEPVVTAISRVLVGKDHQVKLALACLLPLAPKGVLQGAPVRSFWRCVLRCPGKFLCFKLWPLRLASEVVDPGGG